MTHITFVVSRNHLDLVPEIERDCRGGNTEVIVDRRLADRRRRSKRIAFADRRRSERRTQSNARELDLIGIVGVVIP